ncbi:MAG: AbrB/MazE/SpoVT family DNA-binding domain-containing protein [Verrucomicrobia bacterium]|jgi:antitoxin MazE|nr:AbrB/MazE/SpoVT family DNA-binding domain-containing protein [Verrucomicrobiota bacterium]|tara:strand:- start:7265 stop:7504 length:240 start_codon:yes stop_codon:yes gene_type:complete
MKVKLAKWGNSLAVRIPAPIAADASLSAGSTFEVTVASGRIQLSPIECEPTLEELVSQITPENRHEETDWGTATGNEVW